LEGLLSLLLLVTPSSASADWGAQGVFAASHFEDVSVVVSAPDGQGGIVMAWEVPEGGIDWNVRVQRIDAEGNLQWGDIGIRVGPFANAQYGPALAADAAGNTYVAWIDNNAPSGLRVQKLAPDGTTLWDVSGVVVAGTGSTAQGQHLAPDGAGGCYVAWEDFRSGNWDIAVQRIDAAGTPLWTANGIMITTNVQTQRDPALVVADSQGRILVAWEDFRSTTTYDVYAQHIGAAGAVIWIAGGVAVNTDALDQDDVVIVADGTGGGIFVYEHGDNIGANRVTYEGNLPWGSSGVLLTNALLTQFDPVAVSDGAGGAIAVWDDTRNDPDDDIYAMRITRNGSMLWDAQGSLVCSDTARQINPWIAPDGKGGAIIAWQDYRPGTATHIYAQRMDADGVRLWGSSGIAAVAANGSRGGIVVSPDGNGNAVLSALDSRTPSAKPLAQRIEGRHGYWGRPEPIISSIADTPGDQGGYASVNWLASQRDKVAEGLITHYSVWRATDAIAAMAAGMEGKVVDLAEVTLGFQGPAFRVEKTAAGNFYWEWVGEQIAYYAAGYSFNAPTKSDSIGGDPATHHFQVVAHTYSDFLTWPSLPDSGYSVDNLAPAAPLMLTAQRIGGNDVLLEWSPGALPGDLSDYAVYRATMTGVSPDPLFFLSDSGDTTAVDSTATASSAFYYIVTARDIHGNESDPSNEAMVDGAATGVGGDTPALTTLQVLPNTPNPFSAATSLRVGIPVASEVSVEVYDVRGRRVYAHASRMSAGWQALTFDGRDQAGARLPSGVYFYRVRAAGFAQTRKMVISR